MSSINHTILSKSLNDTLNYVTDRYVDQLALVFLIAGLIGFIGNAFTFLQPTLRWNTICIYSLCGSLVDVFNLFINLFPNYLHITEGNLIIAQSTGIMCKLKAFAIVFLPQLSMDLLILSMIDRYACTCALTSPMRYLRRLKMVPWLIGTTVIVTCVVSLYSPILNNFVDGMGCMSVYPILNSVFYVTVQGFITPAGMIVFILLTYRNVRRSRRRVGMLTTGIQGRARTQFIGMVFIQILFTSFFVLQWMGVCMFYWITLAYPKSADDWAITSFVLSLSNNLYYVINIKSFYLSTLTSRVFRETFKAGLLKLIP